MTPGASPVSFIRRIRLIYAKYTRCVSGPSAPFAYTASPEVRAGARPGASPLNFMRSIRHTWAKHTRCVQVLQLLCLHRILKTRAGARPGASPLKFMRRIRLT